MSVASLLILALAAASATRGSAAASAPGVVADREAVRVLSSDYAEKVKLRGAWKTSGEPVARREVCADSGARRGVRRIAVCTTVPGVVATTAGIVDLFVIEPGARRGEARLRSRFAGVESGIAGVPGAVNFLAVGPGTTAFVVDAPGVSGDWRRDAQTLFVEHDGQLQDVLRVHTRLSNTGRCTPGSDAAGRRCTKRTVDLRCALHVDPTRLDDGLYALELRVSGTRGGESVVRTVPILHDAYGYLVSARMLARQGCDAET